MQDWRRRDVLVGLAALLSARCAPQDPSEEPVDGGRVLLEVLSFLDEDDQAVGTVEGVGLDGRLAYDHSGLDGSTLTTPTDAFFIRTRAPQTLDVAGWVVSLPDGDVEASTLAADAQDQGVVLLECSGNGSNRHFGLISAATWSGVRLHDLLSLDDDQLVEIVGQDDHPPPTTNSDLGASWIFRWGDLRDAFLATAMNGEALTDDHGAPVRLIVPGWYGCCNIKWVQELRVVDEDASATSQMREFAARTHQQGTPALAADYRPAIAETSAMVVRVELYDDDTVEFVGVAWGARSGALELHVGDLVVQAATLQGQDASWELWSVNVPLAELGNGQQDLWLTAEEGVPQVRLDQRFYNRSVRIPRSTG